MAQEMNSSQIPTGKVYGGKGVRLKAIVEPLDSLIKISRSMDGPTHMAFRNRYGNILDLLKVQVHSSSIVQLGQYWDVSLRCFTFPNFQLTPTIEEYGEILRMPYKKNGPVYMYQGRLPSEAGIAKLLEIPTKEVELVGTGGVKGIKRSVVEARLLKMAKDGKWESFRKILALAIYGIIIFPCSVGIIDLGAISVFQSVEYYKANPIPAILAETFISLSYCHTKGKGKLRGCLALLEIWMLSHMHDLERNQKYKRDLVTNPLREFRQLKKYDEMGEDGWESFFAHQTEGSLRWKIDWWYGEEIVYCCGDFHNIPLMGPRGCINYNPVLALKQLAFRQRIPSEKEVETIYISYEDKDSIGLCQKIKEAWGDVICQGRLVLGRRSIDADPDYQAWIDKRIKGANPDYAPQDPLLSNNVKEMNKELMKRLEMKEKELENLNEMNAENKRKLSKLQEKYNAIQEERMEKRRRKDQEEQSRIIKLQKENERLRRAMQENDRRMRENEIQMKNNISRLVKVTEEKELLEEEIQNNGLVNELQQEVDNLAQLLGEREGELNNLAQLLENTEDELITERGNAAETIQDLMNKLSQEREVSRNFAQWLLKFEELLIFLNNSIPEFKRACKRAEGMIIPLSPLVEIVNLLNYCNQIAKAFKDVLKN